MIPKFRKNDLVKITKGYYKDRICIVCNSYKVTYSNDFWYWLKSIDGTKFNGVNFRQESEEDLIKLNNKLKNFI